MKKTEQILMDIIKRIEEESGIAATQIQNIINETVEKHKKEEEKERKLALQNLSNWITDQVKQLTNETMYSQIEPSSYDDRLSPQTVLCAFQKYQEEIEKAKENNSSYESDFYTFLEEYTDDIFYESKTWQEDYLVKEIEKRLENQNDELKEAYDSLDMSAWQILRELGGYENTYVNLEGFLNIPYFVNLMFASEEERNQDMTCIMTQFPRNPEEHSFTSVEYFKNSCNALDYMIHQQGHAVAEVYEALYSENSEDTNKFIQSVSDEISEYPLYSMANVTALVTLSGMEIINILDAIAKKEEGNYIQLTTNTRIGLFNEWVGAGSMLDITPEKDIVFPVDMVQNVQFEKAGKNNNNGYTVDEVYGLIGSCWEGNVKLTQNAPALFEENMWEAQKIMGKYK